MQAPQEEQEPQKQVTKELVFQEYPSIENTTRDKTIKAIRGLQFDHPDILWVASEKIHGSNFSVHCSGDKIRYGRRNDFLSEEIDMKCEDAGKFLKESFYDARNLVNTFHNKIVNIYHNLKIIYPEMLRFALYGEYFGGFFPNVESKVKHVQKGVYYIPHHDFMVFDVRIFTDNTILWVDVTDIEKCLAGNLKSVPIFARGTFDQMFAINTKINSTIPEMYGLPKVDDNIIEGFVLRPNHSIKFENNERVILKKKNKEFEQKASAQTKIKQKIEKGLDPQIVVFLDVLETYLNFNRVESVISKFPDVKNRKVIKDEVYKDIMADARKDEFKEPIGDLGKKVKIEFENKIIKVLNDYFTQQ